MYFVLHVYAKCIYLRVRPCICYTSFVILLNHSMLNLQSFAFNFLQRPNLYQRDLILWIEFHCCVTDLILITRMFWLLIVAIFIDDGHGCISLIDYQPNIPRVCHWLYPSPESGDWGFVVSRNICPKFLKTLERVATVNWEYGATSPLKLSLSRRTIDVWTEG